MSENPSLRQIIRMRTKNRDVDLPMCSPPASPITVAKALDRRYLPCPKF